MRKRITRTLLPHEPSNHTEKWLAIEEIATIEVTSEDPDFPIESVFNLSDGRGWRAKEKGEQHIRIIFDQPTAIRRLHLRFVEPNLERTQEFTIRIFSCPRTITSGNCAATVEFQSGGLN